MYDNVQSTKFDGFSGNKFQFDSSWHCPTKHNRVLVELLK